MWTRSFVVVAAFVVVAVAAAQSPDGARGTAPSSVRRPSLAAERLAAASEHLRAGDSERAFECYQSAFAERGADPDGARARVIAARLREQVEELPPNVRIPFLVLAEEELERTFEVEGFAELEFELGTALDESGEPAEAAERLARAFDRGCGLGASPGILHRLAGELANARLYACRFSSAREAAWTSFEYAMLVDDAAQRAERSALALLVIANVESTLGGDEDALAALDAALARTEYGPRLREQLLLSRVHSAKELGRLDDARRSIEELKALPKTTDDVGFDLQLALTELELLDPVRQRAEREAVLARAKELAEATKIGSEDPTLLGAEAWMRFQQGEHAKARELAQRAVDGYESTGDLENLFNVQDTLVRASIALRDLDGARQAVRACLDVVRRALDHVDPSDAVLLRRRFVVVHELEQDVLALEARLKPDRSAATARAGFKAAQRTKGIALASARAQAGSEERSGVVSAAATKAERGTALFAEGLACSSLSVQTALGDDRSGLVEYAHGDEGLFAYCVTSKGLERHELGPWAELEQRAREFVFAIGTSDDRASSFQIARLGHELHQRLFAPIVGNHPNVSRWIVVPTPGLSILPFDALLSAPVPESPELPPFSEWPFLVRTLEIDVCPSTPFAVELTRRVPQRKTPRALVIAAPTYASSPRGTERAGTADSTERWPDLRSATREAQSIANQLVTPAERGEHGELESFLSASRLPSRPIRGEKLDLFVGPSATAEALAKADERYSILYCIAHGRVDLHEPERSALVLPNGRGGVEAFTWRQVEGLHLDADLVVLSACETAVGKLQRGEGSLSLAHAFLQAGARGVIASLWSVNDEKTVVLFADPYVWSSPDGKPRSTCFHTRVLVDGVAPATALYEAKQHASSSKRGGTLGTQEPGLARQIDTSDPYCWAGFVYVGAVRSGR